MLNIQSKLQVNNHTIENCVDEMRSQSFSMIDGKEIIDSLKLSQEEITLFSSCWSGLVMDEYMADGGVYRYRRYGQFSVDSKTGLLRLMPHEAYMQPSYINSINGDIERFFEPLETKFVQSNALNKILSFLINVYNEVLQDSVDWNIRLHPYRIIATEKHAGHPTPEGLHRDGVTFIASLLIDRVNVEGGTTTITDNNETILSQHQLTESFDLLLSDDKETMHEVSSLSPKDKKYFAYRDVLVIAFTKPNKLTQG